MHIATEKALKSEVGIIKQLRSDRDIALQGPVRLLRTSSRICFGVEHGDYNGTDLFGAAIGNLSANEAYGFIWFLYGPNDTGRITIKSLNYPDETADFRVNSFENPKKVKADKYFPWTKYPMGINYILKKNGYSLKKGIRGVLLGRIPGGGLSSSASLTLNTMLALMDVNGIRIADPHRIIDMAQAVENQYVGSPCGKLDQAMILFGRKGKGVLYSPRREAVKYVPLPRSAQETRIVILDTGTKRHGLQNTDYVTRREECGQIVKKYGRKFGFSCLADVTPQAYAELIKQIKSVVLRSRLRYIFESQQRLGAMLKSWRRGAMEDVGRLISADGEGLSGYYDISGPQLEAMVALAKRDPDVLGARMSGGGRFGASFALRRAGDIDALKEIIDRTYADLYPQFEHSVQEYGFVNGAAMISSG